MWRERLIIPAHAAARWLVGGQWTRTGEWMDERKQTGQRNGALFYIEGGGDTHKQTRAFGRQAGKQGQGTGRGSSNRG